MRAELSAGTLDHPRRIPRAVVEAGTVPARLFAARIVILAAVRATEHDRTVAGFPRVVAHHALDGPVFVLDPQVQDEFGFTKGPKELDVAPARNVVHAVSQHDAEGVRAGLQHLRNIERHVQTGLLVIRPAGVDDVVAHFRAVDREFEMTQAADKGHCTFDGFLLDGKLLAEDGHDVRTHPCDVAPRFDTAGTEFLGMRPVGGQALQFTPFQSAERWCTDIVRSHEPRFVSHEGLGCAVRIRKIQPRNHARRIGGVGGIGHLEADNVGAGMHAIGNID